MGGGVFWGWAVWVSCGGGGQRVVVSSMVGGCTALSFFPIHTDSA